MANPTVEDIDRLETVLRDLREERGEMERVVVAGREVAAEIRRAANTAGEAAGMISMEVGRLRRG